ncbi:MAG TPA: hypothetical protein VHJ20_22105 [Polyangia bacterium]|nr:hypothetical protein [Polyangia bacterium]
MKRIVAFGVAASLALGAHAARAYDPATTHAGLTARAVLASSLHKVLARRLARPLGVFEPVALRSELLPTDEARSLGARLGALDPAGGYRPGEDGSAPALAWVVAGAVIANTPAERGRNLFYDPSRGTGLGGENVSFGQSLRQLFDGGGFRDLATGTDFNGSGLPATEWLLSPDNDVGLVAFQRELENSVAAPEPAARGTALARSLLALGGTLAVLEDAGEPAHVRNDFAGAFLSRGRGDRGTPFDRGSAFERFVADTYGRTAVPSPAPAVSRPNVLAYITAADRQGLADRTQRRFFSAGTVPEDAIVDRDTTPAEVMRDARASLVYGLPKLPRLELATLGRKRYASYEGRRLLAYERVAGRVRFFLDDAVYADTARALLPEVGAYATGLVDLLFRAELLVSVDAGAVVVRVAGARGAATGRVRVFAEDAQGLRTELGAAPLAAGDGGASVASVAIPSGALPAGTRRIAAALVGKDDAGDLVAVAEGAPPLPRALPDR